MSVEYDRAFFARNLRPAFIQTNAGKRILDQVEYRDQIWDAVRAGHEPERRPADWSLLADLEAELAFTSDQAEAALRKVNPRSVAAFDLFDDIVAAAPWGEDLRAGGLSQCMWSVGAGGAGTAVPGGYLARFLRCYAQWRATTLLTDFVTVGNEDDCLNTFVGAVSPRLIPTHANFWWASCELAVLLARNMPPGALSEAAVVDLAAYVDSAANSPIWRQGRCDSIPLSPEARDLAESCSYECGSMTNLRFEDLMMRRDIEIHPFISVDGATVPAALHNILGGFHVAVFDALRRTHGDAVTARVFELVCRDALTRLFSASTRALPESLYVHDRAGKELGEIDFAIAHGSVLLIGEVKSKGAPGQVLMNGKRFKNQITEAIEQLDRAVDNLANRGASLVSSGRALDTTDVSTFIGIAVVLHDYGGGIWNSTVLREVREGRPGFAILRAIDVVLLAHTLRDMDELIEYLSFRQDFIDHYGHTADEIDILAAFLENRRRYRHLFKSAAAQTEIKHTLRPRDVDRELLISPVPPASSGPWRATVANLKKI